MKPSFVCSLVLLSLGGCSPSPKTSPVPDMISIRAPQDNITPDGHVVHAWGPDSAKPFYLKVQSIDPNDSLEQVNKRMGTKGVKVAEKEKAAYGRSMEGQPDGPSKVQKDVQYRWKDTKTNSYITVEFPEEKDRLDTALNQVLEAIYTGP